MDDVIERLAVWPPHRRTAKVRDILGFAGNLQRAAYVVRPGQFFVRRLLQFSGLHLNEEELTGDGDVWGRSRKNAETGRVVAVSPEFMVHGRNGGGRWDR